MRGILDLSVNSHGGVDAEEADVVHLWDLGYDQDEEDATVHDHVDRLVIRHLASYVSAAGITHIQYTILLDKRHHS